MFLFCFVVFFVWTPPHLYREIKIHGLFYIFFGIINVHGASEGGKLSSLEDPLIISYLRFLIVCYINNLSPGLGLINENML